MRARSAQRSSAMATSALVRDRLTRRTLPQAARLRYVVAVLLPPTERLGHARNHLLALGCGHVLEHAPPSPAPVTALDLAMRLGQREARERQAVVLHQRMLLERRLRALFLGGVELAALVRRALD